MKTSKFTDEQVAIALRQAEACTPASWPGPSSFATNLFSFRPFGARSGIGSPLSLRDSRDAEEPGLPILCTSRRLVTGASFGGNGKGGISSGSSSRRRSAADFDWRRTFAP